MYFCCMKESQKQYNQRCIIVNDDKISFYAAFNDDNDLDYYKKALGLIIRKDLNIFKDDIFLIDAKGYKNNLLKLWN
ncbi:MAG: hypothetical protein GY793_06560 [Proteobacteria bacterium]|nr:hypothetical protein [Pseudomonadota bacterium]